MPRVALRCVVLCRVVLWCVVFWCVVLCGVVLFCVELCCVVLCCGVLCCCRALFLLRCLYFVSLSRVADKSKSLKNLSGGGVEAWRRV